MKTVHDYLELARELNRINSDRQLAKTLGLSVSAVSAFRRGNAYPSDDTMMKLAELAGISKEQGLLELAYWRTTGETQMVYKSLIKKVAGALSTVVIIINLLFYNPIIAPNPHELRTN